MFGKVQEQKPNHKVSEQARREVTGLVEMDTNHRLLQATECRASIIVHGLKIGANGVHSPTHFPALMQVGDF